MEVFISNLRNETTEKQVKQFFKPHLARLNISIFNCHKPRNKGFAKITVKDLLLGQNFLDLHGQRKPGHEAFQTVKNKLFYMRRPVHCTRSSNEADEFIVKSLTREELALARKRHPEASGLRGQQKVFHFHDIKCGSLDYLGRDLAFVTHYHDAGSGRLRFGRRYALAELDPLDITSRIKQLVLPYSSIESIMLGSQGKPYIIFSLWEAPRFFDKEAKLQTDLLKTLGLRNVRAKANIAQRRRDTALGPGHQPVVASCLSYRFALDSAGVRAILALKQLPGFPDVISWDTIMADGVPFAAQMTQFNTALNEARFSKFSFEVKYQLQRLVQNGVLPPYKVVQMINKIRRALPDADSETLASSIKRLYVQIPFPGAGAEASALSPDTLIGMASDNYDSIVRETQYSPQTFTKQYEQIAQIHKALVTPVGIYLSGPQPEMKNRVLRKYSAFSSYFLQVTFADEDGEVIRSDRATTLDKIYHERFKDVLSGNITIAGRPFEFLGFSHSSLRAQTCWFMAPFVWDGELRHARAVIKDLGDFSAIRSPAKCAARIGQAFSQTFSSVDIPPEAFRILPEVERHDALGILRIFSDGVGTCSQLILKRIWAAYAQSRIWKPTVCQIRYAGAKGMISLDDRLDGEVLCLRPSMIKFEANTTQIEICGAGFKPLLMYLNRQLIKILEDLGVPDQSFIDLQNDAVEQLRSTIDSPINAGYYLQRNDIGKAARLPWLVRKLFYMGMSFTDDSFLRHALELALLVELRELKHRSRIHVDRGVTVYGIMDETGHLKEGEIYCSVQNEKTGLILTGRVVITRCPALHPGDVQFVNAVDVPSSSPLRSVHNCVVFSSKGQRCLPSQLSGGDLDGDLYNIIYDDSLMPSKLSDPADYESPQPIDIGREVGRLDMTNFFIQFMENDQLGRIATLHQTLADQSSDGVFNPACILLAEMHSTAVDFSKTGIPVDMSQLPKASRARPDFQARGPRALLQDTISIKDIEAVEETEEDVIEDEGPEPIYYQSEKVLGRLYRAIDERAIFEEIQKRASEAEPLDLAERVWAYVKRNTALIQYEHYLPFARDIREAYEDNLTDTMLENSHHPTHFVSEVEVFAGTLLGKDGAQSKRQRESSKSMKEKHDRDVTYTVQCILQGEEEDTSKEEALERSIACLDVAIHETQQTKRFGRLNVQTELTRLGARNHVEELHLIYDSLAERDIAARAARGIDPPTEALILARSGKCDKSFVMEPPGIHPILLEVQVRRHENTP
ncbi:MAG: hypothetical protein Q9222_006725, partial [Ikaeria aurantiellina]